MCLRSDDLLSAVGHGMEKVEVMLSPYLATSTLHPLASTMLEGLAE